jgi:hypothetical protein
MIEKQLRIIRTTTLIQALVLATLSAPAAQAYYWGLGSPGYSWGSSLIWPVASTATYPLVGYGLSYANPPLANNLPTIPAAAPERSMNQMPLADGFINAVNEKYHGDLSLALQDKKLLSWAKALKVVGPRKQSMAHLSEQRKQTIASIMQDKSLDSKSKLDTLKILVQPYGEK